MGFLSMTVSARTISVCLLAAALLAPAAAQAEGAKKALNIFGGMVDTMAGIAAEQQAAQAEAAEPKCWTEKRTTKSNGKTVSKTVKVCE